MAKKDVKLNLLNHSEAKVRLLGEYLKRYLNVISNDGYTERIKIYDLFCGQGEYEDGGEGSPLVALRQIKEIYNSVIAKKETEKPKIDCFFNDIDSSKIEKLKIAIKNKSLHSGDFGNIEFSSNDYKNKVDELRKSLPNLKNQKGFIFIDPYGYKDIKSEQIKALLDCKGKSEVLLWLPTQHMYRFSENGTPEALMEFIEELTTYKEWKQNDNIWIFINQLKEGFQSFLGDNYFVDNFSIKKDENTVFCLYFFTSHIKGFEKMLEAKWEIDNENGRGWEYTGNVPSLFFDQKTNELEDKLKAYITSGKRYNSDIYLFTLRQGHLPVHTNQIFSDWQKNEKINVRLKNGGQARKGAFYINYKCYKNDKEKVFYELVI